MRHLAALAVAVLILFASACGEEEPAFPVNLSRRVETSVVVPSGP
jgi:hypothetical protein